jgi:hypothetical protein
MGFKEIVYKDALEYDFKNYNIPYTREKEYKNLKASGLQLGIIANFGEQSFVSKRVLF